MGEFASDFLVLKDDTMSKRNWSLFAAAVMVATAMFWATMLTSPPQSEAALQESPNMADVIDQLALTADPNIPSFEDKYQRHMGVLDVLKR